MSITVVIPVLNQSFLTDNLLSYISSNLVKPLEIILIDNNRAVHGRSPFFPKYDGNDRFLVRCFATFDLEKSAYARLDGERTIAAIYS